MKKNQKLAVGYIRVASYAQKNDTSIEKQKRRIKAYCENLNFKFVRFYVDRGVNGSVFKPPQFQEMLTAARNGEFDMVVADRFRRNFSDFLKVVGILQKAKIDFVSITEGIDTASLTGQITTSILMTLSELIGVDHGRKSKKGSRLRSGIQLSPKG